MLKNVLPEKKGLRKTGDDGIQQYAMHNPSLHLLLIWGYTWFTVGIPSCLVILQKVSSVCGFTLVALPDSNMSSCVYQVTMILLESLCTIHIL